MKPIRHRPRRFSRIIARTRTGRAVFFRRLQWAGLAATAAALVFGLPRAATARSTHGTNAAELAGTGDVTLGRPLPLLKTRAPAGFRLIRPGYRLVARGALVRVQLCRLPGWAGSSPPRLRVELLDPAGQLREGHEQYLPRLGMRMGNNCRTAALRLDAPPDYGETIRICAVAGPGTCP